MTIDLNLLRTFLVLWDERSVTRAADRLHITQPGMSHTLKRMRDELNDPLFIRGPHGLEPTPYAIEIEPRLRVVLNQVQGALERGRFDPAKSSRHFVIAAGSYTCEIVVPRIISRILDVAPGVRISLVKITPDLLNQLQSVRVDVAIGNFDSWPHGIDSEKLYTEEMIWVGRRDNALPGPLTDAVLQTAPRLDVRILELEERAIAQSARGMLMPHSGLSPDGAVVPLEGIAAPSPPPRVVAYDSRTAMEIIARSDLIGILPRRMVETQGGALGLKIIPSDRPSMNLNVSMLWAKERANTVAHRWLRDIIKSCVYSFDL